MRSRMLAASFGVLVALVAPAGIAAAAAPSIFVGTSVSPSSISEGGVGNQTVTYTYTVTNSGTVSVTIMSLTDSRLGALSGSPTCRVGTMLATGATCTFAVTTTLPNGNANTSVLNTFTASARDAASSTAFASATASVTYTNVAPSSSATKSVNPTTVSAGSGGTVTYTYTVTNTSTATTDPVTIQSMSDSQLGPLPGSPTCQVGTVLAPGASCSFTLTTTLSPFSAGTVLTNTFTVTVNDDENTQSSATAAASVTFVNAPPAVTSLSTSPSTINEGGSTTLIGSFTDPDAGQTHTVVTQWGTGEGATTLSLPAGTFTFSASHTYIDDNPTGTPSDVYTITVTVTDGAGGSGTGSTSVTVNNVAPTVTSLSASPAGVSEGSAVTVSGTFHDPGLADTHVVVITWGPGEGTTSLSLAAGMTSFSASHIYLDDNPSGTTGDVYTITVTVTDDDTGSSSVRTGVTVDNVAPIITSLVGPAGSVGVGETVTVTGSFTDTGVQDTHVAQINWGDGTSAPATVSESSGSGTFAATHAYASPGTFTIVATVTDDDTGSASSSTSVTVRASLEDLGRAITGLGLPQGTRTSLLAKVSAAQDALAAGQTKTACNNLNALINEARAQSGKKLTPGDAQAVIDLATALKNQIGCP